MMFTVIIHYCTTIMERAQVDTVTNHTNPTQADIWPAGTRRRCVAFVCSSGNLPKPAFVDIIQ